MQGNHQQGTRGFAIGVFLIFAFLPLPLWSEMSPTNDLPPLAPPYAQIPPTFWEQHGVAVMICVGIILALAGTGAWIMFRPRPATITPPEIVARERLAQLRTQPETGALLSEVSQTLQHYLEAVLNLPHGAMTTTELSQALAGNALVGAGMSAKISNFLRECDQRKFSTVAPAQPLNAADQAWELISEIEKQRAMSAVKNRA